MAASGASELTQILLDSQNADQAVRCNAEQKLITAELNNFAAYVTGLAHELANEKSPEVVRQLAGIVLKNSISGSDLAIDKAKQEKWLSLPDSDANIIRESVLNTLSSSSEAARSAACQVISKTGRLDIVSQRWPTLLNSLMQLVCGVDIPVAYKRAAVTALGYLCEDIYSLSQHLMRDLMGDAKEQKNLMLTTVIHGVRSEDPELSLAGCKALYHVLLFATENMANQAERDYIFKVVGEALNHADLAVRHAGWECVLQLATEFYPSLEDYAEALCQHSISTITEAMAVMDRADTSEDVRRRTEAVALAALEFWNSLCDVEISIELDEGDTDWESKHYIRKAKGALLEVLFEAMTKQDNDASEMEEWTLAMAAGTSVALCAQVLRDEILEPSLQFVNANFGNADWKKREAAVLAYGSIMEGPTSECLETLVQQSFVHLCNALNDKSVAVRDTTAWTIGRIASFHTRCIVGLLGTATDCGLMVLLLEKLNDESRVASFVCYALHEIARNIRDATGVPEDDPNAPTAIDPFFRNIVAALLTLAQKSDVNESNLRAAAFEALSETILAVGGTEWQPVMAELLTTLSTWLDRSFGEAASEEVFQFQGLLCGCLNNIIDRLGPQTDSLELANVSLSLFNLFAKVAEAGLAASGGAPSGPVGGIEGLGASEERAKVGSEEDALLAIGTLVRRCTNAMIPQMPKVTELLLEGLRRPHEVRYCRACIGVICEVAAVMNLRSAPLEPCLRELIPELYVVLQDSTAPISLKPALIGAVGDLVVGMEGDFEPYLEPFLLLLGHAASTKRSDGPESEEWIMYFQDLRDGLLEACSGIIHGLRTGNKLHLLQPQVNNWLNFIQLVVEDPKSSTSNFSKATEVTGDLVTSYRSEFVKHLLTRPFYKLMIERGQTTEDEEFKRRTLFLQSAVVRCGGH